MMNAQLYECVQKAQFGDRTAMQRIIEAYYPLIRKTAGAMAASTSKDFEQTIIEKVVRAVTNYDLDSVPDFISFCNNDSFS